ncbi:unnamed protein product [Ilex paraguariensis]|uniref:Uncharacterized protein n=1 Tax=Ilex paraguariensis TaxID=185542 RepID=A0ABC8R5J8_9AQUA
MTFQVRMAIAKDLKGFPVCRKKKILVYDEWGVGGLTEAVSSVCCQMLDLVVDADAGLLSGCSGSEVWLTMVEEGLQGCIAFVMALISSQEACFLGVILFSLENFEGFKP